MPVENTSADQGTKENSSLSDLSGILSKLLSGENAQSENAKAPSQDLFSSLLQNPDIVSKIPQLISAIGPMLSGSAAQGSASSEKASNTSAQVNTSENKEKRFADDRSNSRAALLCAMKPYLSRERRDAIDYIIKLSRLGEILKTL